MTVRTVCFLVALACPSLGLAQDSRPAKGPASQPSEPGTVPIAPVRSQGGLVFTGQEGWQQLPPKSRMRVVTYRLPAPKPAAEGAPQPADGQPQPAGEPAELVVYFFGGGGGGVDANLERWYGQFSQPDGSATKDKAKREQREIQGMTVHVVDVTGTYVAETRPGSGVRANKPDQRMLAAIFEAPSGPHFVKLVGPAATVERWRESFDAFLQAVQGEF